MGYSEAAAKTLKINFYSKIRFGSHFLEDRNGGLSKEDEAQNINDGRVPFR